MTNGELQELLKRYPADMTVVDSMYDDIDGVEEKMWMHTNFPYDKPNKKVIMLL